MALTLPTVTGYSAFWENTGDTRAYAPTSVAQKGYRSPLERQLAKLFRRNQLRSLVAVMTALNGAVAGGTATASYKRVKAPALPSAGTPQPTYIGEMAGNRTIETQTDISRVTTSADVTYINDITGINLLEAEMATTTYPVDSSGNGGGGKLNNGAVSI